MILFRFQIALILRVCEDILSWRVSLERDCEAFDRNREEVRARIHNAGRRTNGRIV